MANSVTKYAGTATYGGGGSGTGWTNLGNITAQDGTLVTGDISGGGYDTGLMTVTNFGFSLPSNAIVRGIIAEIYKVGTSAEDTSIQLRTSTKTSIDRGYPGSAWPTGTGGYVVHGLTDTDLWGVAWTASDINSSTFGIQIDANNITGGGTASIDTVRITVYWDYVPLTPGTLQEKNYNYVVTRQGVYLGLLPNVTSDFQYTQDINTAGVQIVVHCGISADTASLDITTIDDETGTPLQDELGNNLQTEKYPDVFGNANSKALFRNGNQLTIYEVSDYNQNGKQVFSGDIERWSALYGGNDGDEIVLTAYSDGAELNNYIMTGGDTLDQSQTSYNNVHTILESSRDGYARVAQTFTVGGGVTNLEGFSFYYQDFAFDKTVVVYIYGSVSDATSGIKPLASGSATIGLAGVSPAEGKVIFTPAIAVTPGQVLTAVVFAGNSDDIGINIYYQNTNVYANGAMYTADYGGGGGGGYAPFGTSDLMFKTWYGGNATTVAYSSVDTGNILIDAMTRYASKGGVIKGTSSTVATTGVAVTYTFKVATVLEGIQKMLDLSPYNYYWYVDIGTDTLYFQPTATTAKYTLIKGRHITGLNMTASTENVTNLLLFTGGPTAGVNLYKQYSDSVSITNNKQRLDRKTDNRVTVTATADAIGTSTIASKKDEKYQTSVTIADSTMDISLFRPGDTVGFAGFGNFVDGLVLQISSINYSPHQVTLSLGDIAPRVNETLLSIDNSLNDLNTIDNPSTPS